MLIEKSLAALEKHAVFTDDYREGLSKSAETVIESLVAKNHALSVLGNVFIIKRVLIMEAQDNSPV